LKVKVKNEGIERYLILKLFKVYYFEQYGSRNKSGRMPLDFRNISQVHNFSEDAFD
jgi:hypothetical protein